MSRKCVALLALVVLVLGMLTACGGTQEGGGVPADAALKVTGNVTNEVGWSEADVRALDTTDAEYTNKDGETSTYTGVSINSLLEKAGVKSDAATVVLVADDGYTAEVALPEMTACADCIVAFRDSGGFSAVLPGFASNVQVKGIVEIQVK